MITVMERDCSIFTGNVFGCCNKSSILTQIEYAVLLAGNATSVDTGIFVDAGTALTNDILIFNGGDSSFGILY